MLTKRIIPCLDIKNGRVVKGINFVNLRDAGSPVECARRYENWLADELVFLDITASHEKRDIVVKLVKDISKNIFTPFTVGGGLKSAADIRAVLLAGADKVSLNTAAVLSPKLLSSGAKIFGRQCIVCAIDARQVRTSKRRGGLVRPKAQSRKWEVYIYGGRKGTGIDAVQWAKQAEDMGAGEILLTSMDKDGTKAGFDIPLLERITGKVNIPVIASGGAGTMKHFYEVFTQTGVSAALAASIFHYGEIKIPDLKKYLSKKNIPVRI